MNLKIFSAKRWEFCSGLTVLTIVGPVGVQPMSMITAITMRLANEHDIDDCPFSLPTFSEGLLQYRTLDETHIILQFSEILLAHYIYSTGPIVFNSIMHRVYKNKLQTNSFRETCV